MEPIAEKGLVVEDLREESERGFSADRLHKSARQQEGDAWRARTRGFLGIVRV